MSADLDKINRTIAGQRQRIKETRKVTHRAPYPNDIPTLRQLIIDYEVLIIALEDKIETLDNTIYTYRESGV